MPYTSDHQGWEQNKPEKSTLSRNTKYEMPNFPGAHSNYRLIFENVRNQPAGVKIWIEDLGRIPNHLQEAIHFRPPWPPLNTLIHVTYSMSASDTIERFLTTHLFARGRSHHWILDHHHMRFLAPIYHYEEQTRKTAQKACLLRTNILKTNLRSLHELDCDTMWTRTKSSTLILWSLWY